MRIQAGYYRGAFFHPQFIRGNKRSIITMTRKKKAGKQQELPMLGPPASQDQAAENDSISPSRTMMMPGSGLEVARLPSEQGHPLSMHDQQMKLHQLQQHTLSERPIAGSPYPPPQKIPVTSLPFGLASLQRDDNAMNTVQIPTSRSFVDEKIHQNPSLNASTIPPLLLGNTMSNKFPMFSNADTLSCTKLDDSSTTMKDTSSTSSPTAWMQSLIDSFLKDDNDGATRNTNAAAMDASGTETNPFDLEPTPIEEMVNKSKKRRSSTK